MKNIFKVGEKVRWNDPKINDFNEEEREDILARIYRVEKILFRGNRYDQAVYLISNDFSEAEVYHDELELA